MDSRRRELLEDYAQAWGVLWSMSIETSMDSDEVRSKRVGLHGW